MNCLPRFSRCLLSVLVFLSVLAGMNARRITAGDWPQILGPRRNGIAEKEELLTRWPEAGPSVAWEMKVGEGFAGAAVQDNMAIIFHRVGEHEIIEARGLQDGKQLWQQQFDTDYVPRISPDAGPRCVPAIHAGQVFAFGAAGDLHCVTLKDGKHEWSRDLHEDFDADEGYFGAGSSPLVHDGKVFINVGGKDGGIVALSATDGKTVWSATKEQASYSSPILPEIGGKLRLVFDGEDGTKLDLDVFDPPYVPSTGTPEPGGLDWYAVTALLREVCRRRSVVGFDIVELCPGDNPAADFLAAKLTYKLLSYVFHDRPGKTTGGEAQ